MATKEELLKKLLEGPGLKPPPNVIPNLINPPTKQHINLLCQVTCLTLSSFFVLIRMYTKIYVMRTHGWEDVACLIAWLGSLVYSGLQLLPIFTLFPGVHQWNVKAKYLAEWSEMSNIVATLFGPTIFFAKLSILLLYLRIFVVAPGTKTYYTIHFIIWFNMLFYLTNLPLEIWACVPRRKIWQPTLPGHCLNNDAVLITGGVVNVVTDWAILSIPLFLIGRLQMPLVKKIGVLAVFATGFLACTASVMHLVTAVQLHASPDKTYRLFPLALWTSAELALGVICSSLLTMPQFYRHVSPIITSKLSSSRKNNSSQSGNGPVPRNPSRPIPQWHDLFDTNTTITNRTENYLELNDSVDWQSPKTTIQGGKDSQMGNYINRYDASEESALEAGIVKTVRVEQFPNFVKQ